MENKMDFLEYKCKYCGGDLVADESSCRVGKCVFCGTQQTIPKSAEDKRAMLYDRAEHLRKNNDFDKAIEIYEKILEIDMTDPEAYWSLILCRYGIEYVEDPQTGEHLPTVNRAQYTSIFADEDYKSAISHADEEQKALYEREAHMIDDIQRGFLAISQKEDPFDVFICYKENDDRGRRTRDSVLAQDLYYQLKQEGFKVFFARITLEDKLGSAYEPYIFAAINSAKVMVVVGTKPEFFNAVWVKNEWSRFLSLIKHGTNKTLVPAYRDMDPYDLPEEFSHLQAQDMSKLGFMQDLIRGIRKIINGNAPKTPTVIKETVVKGGDNLNSATLVKRARLFVEDGDYERADEFCERALDQDPENADAYVVKLMIEFNLKLEEELADLPDSFDSNSNYIKAIRFGNDSLRKRLKGYVSAINERTENQRLEGLYNHARGIMSYATASNEFFSAAEIFNSIANYLDSEELANKCSELGEKIRKEEEEKDALYDKAMECKKQGSVANLGYAIVLLNKIPNWKDARIQLKECEYLLQNKEKRIADSDNGVDKKKAKAAKKEKNRKTATKVFTILTIILALVLLLKYCPNQQPLNEIPELNADEIMYLCDSLDL